MATFYETCLFAWRKCFNLPRKPFALRQNRAFLGEFCDAMLTCKLQNYLAKQVGRAAMGG